MLKITVSLLLLVLFLSLTGCQTLTADSEGNIQEYSRIADLNRRMLAQDIEAFWLLDRPSRLTRYYIPSH